jgi:hypothetical protein
MPRWAGGATLLAPEAAPRSPGNAPEVTMRGLNSSVIFLCFALLLTSIPFAAGASQSAASRRTLVLPLRSVGVGEQTVVASASLLAGSLEDLGMTVVRRDSSRPPLPEGPEACDAPECAAQLMGEYGTELVVYGSLTQLGGKIIARINVLWAGEAAPYYRDQLTATSEDDLDVVMRRFAEGIAAGRPNSNRATVESVTNAETVTPPRRATRSGMGVRAGFLFPTANSYGGADRLTNLRAVFRYELTHFQIETTPMLGFSWGKGNFEWSMLDLGASRIFGTGDLSPYLGASLGVHTVTVERQYNVTYSYPGYPDYTYETGMQQTETVPTADLVAGLMALRTYDFVAVVELRFHFVFEKFNRVGGGGAQGVMLTIGTSR